MAFDLGLNYRRSGPLTWFFRIWFLRPACGTAVKSVRISISVCVCNPWSHRGPFGVLHFCKQQGTLGACVRREPTKALTQRLWKRTCFGAPGRIIRRSWWPHVPFHSADLHGYVVICRLDVVLRFWPHFRLKIPRTSGLELFRFELFVCACVPLESRGSVWTVFSIRFAGRWSARQMSPANEDASVAL